MKREVYTRRVDTRDELPARILDAATPIKSKIYSVEVHVILVHELKSASRMTDGLSNTCCEL